MHEHAAFIRSFTFTNGAVWSVCRAENCRWASGNEWDRDTHSGRWGLQQKTTTGQTLYGRSHGTYTDSRSRKRERASIDIAEEISDEIESEEVYDATELSTDDLVNRENAQVIVDEDEQTELAIEAAVTEEE